MSTVTAAMRGVPVTLQAAGTTTGNGTVIAIPNTFTNHLITIKGSAGINAGAVQVEAADAADYAGTWAAQGSAVTAVASAEKTLSIAGLLQFLRARVSVDISGGTITVTYLGS